ncbi:MAG: carbamate kinase [Deltaproteobacteria bacterium]|nr:carbamate kinase [Deltaproteobacteria bacterium]
MKRVETPPLAIVSLGGNALIQRGEKGTIEEQFAHTEACVRQIARMIEEGYRIVITHGNGPIVGNIVIQNEAARNTIPPMPLYICDADSEGGIGFVIQQTLYNQLKTIHTVKEVVTVITQVVVNEGDPAFNEPTKPIGPFYTGKEAKAVKREKGWKVVEDSGRGYRRVVSSPRPIRVIESGVIMKLAASGVVVIAVGGGGVPVIELSDGRLKGVEAVIDKDLATSVLAGEIGAERIINLTQVDCVYINFGKENQEGLRDVTLDEMKGYYREEHFPPGSMGPKIKSAIEFLEGGGREVIITAPELIEEAMQGRAGTRIHRER